MGTDVEGRNIIVVDDMIASGGSMVEVARELRKRGAKSIYLVATFALLTEGAEVFINAYNEGLFNKLYATNLSYVPEEIKKEIWYEDVDCSMQIAEIIDKFNNHQSIEPLFNNKKQLIEKIERIKNS
jgi:ribose-phosphate pyrophosphokinase